MPVDVSDQVGRRHTCSTPPPNTYGSVDIAFNNAGISPPDDDVIENTELARVAEGAGHQPQVGVPVAAGPRCDTWCPQQKGSIINTASFVAVMGSATSQISYTASKGGVLAMSRELGVQFARSRVSGSTRCARDR